MKKRSSATARILAALALVGAIVAVIIIVPAALKDNSEGSKKTSNHPAKQQPKKQRTKAKTYEVQEGDTLTVIAHKTGVSIAEIQTLNPEVDPQILTVGETLKLR